MIEGKINQKLLYKLSLRPKPQIEFWLRLDFEYIKAQILDTLKIIMLNTIMLNKLLLHIIIDIYKTVMLSKRTHRGEQVFDSLYIN